MEMRIDGNEQEGIANQQHVWDCHEVFRGFSNA